MVDHPIKLLDGFWLGITFGQPDLVGPGGKIQWLTQASRWHMTPGQVEITYRLPKLEAIRREYGVDDHEGMLVRLELINQSRKKLPLTLHFLARTDLRSAWLGENRLTWRDGRDEAVYLDELACIAAYNTVNPVYVLFGAQRRPSAVAIGSEFWATKQTKGQGISGHLGYLLNLPGGASEEVIFIIAGSTRSSEAALATFQRLQAAPDELGARQRQRYLQVIERCALHSDDELVDTAFGWAKINLQMLERNVPGIGQGLAAGLPDFPWWFGTDTTYTTLPLVASGQFELALASLRNLARYSQAIHNDGRVVHEVLTQGHVHDNGHLVEIPLFVRACYHAFRWTGDRDFLQELYSFCKRGLLDVVWKEIYVPLVKVSWRHVSCSRVAVLKRWISPPILTRRCFAWQNWPRRSAMPPSLLNCGRKRSAYVISSTPPGGSRKRVSMVISTHRQKPYLHRTRRCEPKCRYGSLEILLNWSIVKLFLNALLNSISLVEKPWDRNGPGS